MWKVIAYAEADVDDHSKEDLDVSNLFSIVNAFYFNFTFFILFMC